MKTLQSHQISERIVQTHRSEARHPHMLPLARPRLVTAHSKRTRRLREDPNELLQDN